MNIAPIGLCPIPTLDLLHFLGMDAVGANVETQLGAEVIKHRLLEVKAQTMDLRGSQSRMHVKITLGALGGN